MKQLASLFAVAMVASVALLGCSENSTLPVAQEPLGTPTRILSIDEPCGTPWSAVLWAGQSIDVGDVMVANDGVDLCVQIDTYDGWVMTETHVAVATCLDDIPQTGSGNPKVGHFALSSEYEPPMATAEHCIPLTAFDYNYSPGTVLFIAVHAVVVLLDENGNPVQEETAWADGEDFPGHSWATYFTYVVQTCGEEQEGGGGE